MKYYTITVNGMAYEVSVEESNASSFQTASVVAPAPRMVAPTAVPVAPVAPVEAPAAEVAPAPAPVSQASGTVGNLKIDCPMPGKIISVKVNVGQVIKKGEVILILEAMKMENEIVAPEAGTVASINVSAGEMVESGILLASLN